MNIFKYLAVAGASIGAVLGIIGFLGQPISTLIAAVLVAVLLTAFAALIIRHYFGPGGDLLWAAPFIGSTSLWDGMEHLSPIGYSVFLISMLALAVTAFLRERGQSPAPA